MTPPPPRSLTDVLGEFLRLQTTAGLLLVATAAIALLWANGGGAETYFGFLHAELTLGLAPLVLTKSVLHWINDGLMALFFLVVGLEIKREALQGELADWRRALLPTLAAVGGMVGPALVYLSINQGSPETLRGWAIPVATDIAFALGVLALLGNRVPVSLRVFLLALAIIDDLGAILLIAFLFTSDLSVLSLSLAAVCLAALVALNGLGVRRLWPYLLVGALLWLCVLKSGVHATLAGVALAFCIPLRDAPAAEGEAPLLRVEHALHPWVTYGIMPLFAFANAGVSLAGVTFATLLSPVPLGIIAGLFVGKLVGVTSITWLAVRLGLGALPPGVGWSQFIGLAFLTGVGFTMSLFIGTLAFPDTTYEVAVRVGVLTGSILSATCGYLWLRAASGPPAALR
jgi:Na+:H+ antiporter, NhaA family